MPAHNRCNICQKRKCFCSDRQMSIKCARLRHRQALRRGKSSFAALVKTRNLKTLEYASEDQGQMFLREQSMAEVETAFKRHVEEMM